MSLEETRCSDCHGEADPVADHAVAACVDCHSFEIEPTGTRVQLAVADPELCLTCHADLSDAAALQLEAPHAAMGECLSCHAAHDSRATPLLASARTELCADCHPTGSRMQRKHGQQLTAATDCTSCHAPHGSNRELMLTGRYLHPPFTLSCKSCHQPPFAGRVRLTVRDERLCTGCHGDQREEAADGGVIHGALEERTGLPSCVSCHDPHMSRQRKLLRAKVPALCSDCHSMVVDAALAPSGHPPAAIDCRSCHRPHASAEPLLLTQPLETACTGCHGGGAFNEVHLGAAAGDLRCIDCHDPHGTENPSNLATHLHPPILDRGCPTCHQEAFDVLREDGASTLCLECHADIGQLAETSPVQHEALAIGDCRDCHNPHASPQEHLVKAPGPGPCVDCHLEQAPTEGETAHGVIDLVGCRACHEPHGGTHGKLLRVEGSELCLSCHDPSAVGRVDGSGSLVLLDRFAVPEEVGRRVAVLRLSEDGERDHPVAGHRVRGLPSAAELRRVETRFEGELECLSCHDPHKGRHKLLLWDAETTFDACTECHAK